jgi:hypothetical protein
MYAMYYASMLQCWQLIRILVRTNYPCLRVGCHRCPLSSLVSCVMSSFGVGTGSLEG